MKKKQKIAFVTYNRIGDGKYKNGVLKKGNLEIYIAQNGHLAKWGVPDVGDNKTRENIAKAVTREYNLKDMDHIFLYVGTVGAEVAIEETATIDPKKITYVMCGCNYGTKKDLIDRIGNRKANIIKCECGGRETLEELLNDVLYGIRKI